MMLRAYNALKKRGLLVTRPLGSIGMWTPAITRPPRPFSEYIRKERAPLLYKSEKSYPCRAVLMVIAALKIDVELRDTETHREEFIGMEFKRLNPTHTLPFLNDNGFVVTEIHAIVMYLVTKYSNEHCAKIYPPDLKIQTHINQRLFFNSGVLQGIACQLMDPIFIQTKCKHPVRLLLKVKTAYNVLNQYLKGQSWLAGSSMTIADLVVIPTMTCIELFVPVESKVYPYLAAWLQSAKKLPFYEINERGLKKYRRIVGNYFEY